MRKLRTRKIFKQRLEIKLHRKEESIIMPNNYKEQEKTLKDVLNKLKTYHKCAVIRPTGFGKTYMLTELIKHYNKVLYLYPSAVIRDTVVNRYYGSLWDEKSQDYIDEDGNILDPETIDTFKELNEIENVTLMTYHKLIRLMPEDFKAMDYDLILFDECHRIGGPKTKLAVSDLFTANPTADFVGATATPIRMDNFDVVSVFFSDIMTYTYTLFDAIEAGMLQKPNYCYCTYDLETDLKDAALTAGEDIKDPTVVEVLKAKLIEMSKIVNIPTTIRNVCNDYAVDTNYMKFIVFFASKNHMKEKLEDVMIWFREAYPDHSISSLKISSSNKIESQNTDKLELLQPRDKHIDIIACIDMLNMGYHVNNLTGILMYRGTKSNTIFTQQLGRALSAGANNSAIVFDVVDNLHRKAVYELRSSLTTKTKSKTKKEKAKPTIFSVSSQDNTRIVTIDDNGVEHATAYHFDDNGNIVDYNNITSTLKYDAETNQIYDAGSADNKDINTITSKCLNATGHMATYRELIAKAVAEPMTQRCKYALELHFRSWCQVHNVPYPISDDELKTMYGLSKEDFYKHFIAILQSNNIGYPLQDAAALLNIGTNNNTDIPLAICAKARNVSIRQILDVFKIS